MNKTGIRMFLALGLGLAVATSTPALAQEAKPAGASKQEKTKKQKQKTKAVTVGTQIKWLADWELKTAQGESFRFADWMKAKKEDVKAGKVPRLIVVSFWSCKCPWQNAWDPEISAIAKEYRDKGVRVLAVDSNNPRHESKQDILAYLKQNKLAFPVLMDPGNKLADRFGAQTTPHIYVFDNQGRVVYTGAVDNDGRKKRPENQRKYFLRDALDASLSGKPVPQASTKPMGCSIKRERRTQP